MYAFRRIKVLDDLCWNTTDDAVIRKRPSHLQVSSLFLTTSARLCEGLVSATYHCASSYCTAFSDLGRSVDDGPTTDPAIVSYLNWVGPLITSLPFVDINYTRVRLYVDH